MSARSTLREIGRWLFAALFVGVGVCHFTATTKFAQAVPPILPFPRAIVLISGVIEIALGLLLLIPRTSRLAAWGLIALLIAVFPANINIYHHQDLFPLPPILHLLRLPAQALLILWAYAYTRPRAPASVPIA